MTDLWYKKAIFYELYPKAFYDSDGDGKGDIGGLIHKLDYLAELGIDCIWLLPVFPSPGKDDGYDVADFKGINPVYGSLKLFRKLIHEVHERKMRIIIDLVLNHTSDQHPWFLEAKKSRDNPYHDYYVWSETQDKYKEARVIFKDYERSNWEWNNDCKQYYWHRFYSHQPDLNYDNPRVREEVVSIVRFWLDMGIDGFRVDAVPYLYEREGTSCENLGETHEFVRGIRAMMDKDYPEAILLAEANQWPEDLREYFGNGDEFHMGFNFPVMPRLFMSLKQEHHGPIVDIVKRTPEIPANCQWAIFLRNHDELTLEMCTDEERDYMFREYAEDPQMKLNLGIRRRLMPLLGRDYRKFELLNVILMTLPGSPVIYYGDEIGMGDNVYLGDRNGVRTPMHWDDNRNAGFSRCKPSMLYAPVITDPDYNYETVNVEGQTNLKSSVLNWMKRLIHIRKKYEVLSMGELRFLYPENKKILVFIREWKDDPMLCVYNLSASSQAVEIDLREFDGYFPVEVFGENPFPRIGELPYLLTLTPYAYYIFELTGK